MLFIDQKQVDVPTSGLSYLAEDCLRFTKNFFHLIQQSAQHIYLSALPLSPRSSTFHPMIIREKTLIKELYGHPETWGATLQTIPGCFTCMTTFSHWIAVSGPDGVVRIYHTVTGALRLSLGPMNAVKAVRGSPDGSTLFCAHQESSITLWGIQTGGLIRAFALTEGIRRFEVSLKGRYLACGFSSAPVKVLEVKNRVGNVAIRDLSQNTTLFCWLAPEEQLAINVGESVHIWDVVAGGIVRSFRIIEDHQERYGSERQRSSCMVGGLLG